MSAENCARSGRSRLIARCCNEKERAPRTGLKRRNTGWKTRRTSARVATVAFPAIGASALRDPLASSVRMLAIDLRDRLLRREADDASLLPFARMQLSVRRRPSAFPDAALLSPPRNDARRGDRLGARSSYRGGGGRSGNFSGVGRGARRVRRPVGVGGGGRVARRLLANSAQDRRALATLRRRDKGNPGRNFALLRRIRLIGRRQTPAGRTPSYSSS